ncbi:glycosyltransferase [Aliarcobacter butzleri]|uniref:glycosyltransferase n=1 Tax=Aliarcobacter butzleri TaxID=28197 RepID=UPI00263C0341|nr:glycosyltransferase [Aliarcobacter butzleri]MDN5091642.1 glycosyltransferase [Aliarcobacter butzleri]
MKKIVFLIDNLKGGGAEKAIKIIVEGLYEKGFDPVVIFLEDQRDYSLNEKIETYSLTKKISKYNFFNLYFKLLKLLKKLNPDIIYATNTKAQILSLLTKLFFKSERIINIQVDLKKQYEGREYIFNFYNKLLKYADGYSFISQGIYQNLKQEIPHKKNIFIPNPIDFAEIDNLKIENIDEKYKHIFEKKVIITIGRLTQQKGQWDLLEAFSLVNDKDVNLVILGSGEKENELKNLAKKYKIENKVFFLGFQKNPFKFLYNSDIFVLSSYWEGFGNVIVEAMRCELPIISTDCPSGPREILAPTSDVNFKLNNNVELAEFGILVPVSNPNDLAIAIKNFSNESNLLNVYKNMSIQRANNYDKEVIVNEFINNFLR